MNQAIIMGRLTSDVELKYTPNGVAVTRFTVAVNRKFSKEQQADFLDCVAWRQQAEFVCKYFKKGSMIAIVGSIQKRAWDGTDGKKQYATEIIVNEVYFTGSKQEQRPASEEIQDFPEEQPDAFTDEFESINYDDEDLPF